MKRSRHIDLARMRRPVPALLALAVAAVSLQGCGAPDAHPVDIYSSLNDCIQRHTFEESLCRMLDARARLRTGAAAPQYAELTDCEAEFGRQQCFWTVHPMTGMQVASPYSSGWIADRRPRDGFCPEGYIERGDQCVAASPVYLTSSGSGGGGWHAPDGRSLPDAGEGRVEAGRDAFRYPVGNGTTLRRGGFGEMAMRANNPDRIGSNGGRSGFHWGG